MRPTLQTIDWTLIGLYAVFAIALGTWFTRRAGTDAGTFFVGDRNLPWWIAGTSMVATTFAADTPLAVTGIIASGGISGNWLWWSWAIAHLTATFLFARMWRRSGVITDAEITEVRYSGRAAAALRGFKAVYFGVFVNCLTMAWVIAAMVKISQAFFAVDAWVVIVLCVAVAVLYTSLGGFHSVVVTDMVQFGLGIGGAIALAVIVVRHYGGIGDIETAREGLIGALATTTRSTGQSLSAILDFVPARDHPMTPFAFFVALLIAGWWRYAEGNGYIVQRLAACKDEGHAQGASLWFAIAHNALRPWPWILVGLAALIIYPVHGGELPESLQSTGFSAEQKLIVRPAVVDQVNGGSLALEGATAGSTAELLGISVPVEADDDGGMVARFPPFSDGGVTTLTVTAPTGEVRSVPGVVVRLTDREMGYPLLMGRFLPPGLLGLVIASLLAAFMSTIDTHTNWGASYLVQDLYKRFLRPDEDERHYVWVSRLAIVFMGILAGLAALVVQNIAEVWRFLITLGAGLGSVTAARWYWSRVTPYAEFAALGVTTVLAIGLQLFGSPTLFGGPNPLLVTAVPAWAQIIIIAGASLATWVPVALLGPRNDAAILRSFAAKVQPPGPGWAAWRETPAEAMAPMLLRLFAGGVVVYGALFGIGYVLLGQTALGLGWLAIVIALLVWIIRSGRAVPKTDPGGA